MGHAMKIRGNSRVCGQWVLTLIGAVLLGGCSSSPRTATQWHELMRQPGPVGAGHEMTVVGPLEPATVRLELAGPEQVALIWQTRVGGAARVGFDVDERQQLVAVAAGQQRVIDRTLDGIWVWSYAERVELEPLTAGEVIGYTAVGAAAIGLRLLLDDLIDGDDQCRRCDFARCGH
jgi:hypothetical protein